MQSIGPLFFYDSTVYNVWYNVFSDMQWLGKVHFFMQLPIHCLDE